MADEDLVIRADHVTVVIANAELTWEYARAGGPGGQNVNKVSSRAILRWSPGKCPSLSPGMRERLMAKVAGRLTNDGELLISSQKTRDQGRNREDCLDKLRDLITQIAVPPIPRKPTKPSRSSVTERLESKKRRSQTKNARKDLPYE